MTREEQLEMLRSNNPFIAGVAGDPWKDVFPDVESINKEASDGLCDILVQQAQRPVLGVGVLVLGETGSGKTHLVRRILKFAQRSKYPISFAYIQPIEDPKQTFRYLLREIAVNLCRPNEEGSVFTQLDSIIADIMVEFLRKDFRPKRPKEFQKLLQRLEKNPLEIYALSKKVPKEKFDYVETKAIEFLTSEYPELPEELPRVMFQYRLKAKRRQVINWLKCADIDEDAASLLGVHDRRDWTEDKFEHEARKILSSIALLLARYKRLMLVCFDFLEALDTQPKVNSFGKMVRFVIEKTSSILPVVFARGKAWEERLSADLDQFVVTPLEVNRFELMRGCNPGQALDIVRARLALFLGEENASGVAPFEEAQLREIFKQGTEYTPRQVITLANRKLRRLLGGTPPPPPQRLPEEFETRYQTILADFERYQPDRERLRRTLELLLRNHPGGERSVPKLNLNRTGHGYIDCTCSVKSEAAQFRAAIIIDVKLHHGAVGAALRRGIEFLDRSAGGKALYLRDARCLFPERPRWPQTNEMREQFEHKGGKVYFLDDRTAARWYALVLLSYAVKEGDVTVVDEGGKQRTVTMEQFHTFIRERIHGGPYPEFQCVLEELMGEVAEASQPSVTRGPSPKSITDEAVKTLRPVPIMMMTSKKLAEALKQRGLRVDIKTMLLAIGQFPERFEIIPSRDGVLVRLKKEWLDAQS